MNPSDRKYPKYPETKNPIDDKHPEKLLSERGPAQPAGGINVKKKDRRVAQRRATDEPPPTPDLNDPMTPP